MFERGEAATRLVVCGKRGGGHEAEFRNFEDVGISWWLAGNGGRRPRDRIPEFSGRGISWWFAGNGGAATRQNSGILKAWGFLVARRELGEAATRRNSGISRALDLFVVCGNGVTRSQDRIPEF